MSLLTVLRSSGVPNPCVTHPLMVSVTQWPTRGLGAQRLRYEVSGPSAVVSVAVRYVGSVETVTVTDLRGCVTTMTRP